MKLEEISGERFLYEYYDSDFYHRLGLNNLFGDNDLVRVIKNQASFTVIGYCKSDRIQIRPRGDQWYVLMLEDDDGYFWFHITEDVLNQLKK